MQAIALLCDYAQVNGGKLYVTGAGITLVGTPSPAPPHPISLSVGVLITIPWNAHNHPHRLKISLVSEDGERIRIAEPLPGQSTDDDDGSLRAQFNAGRSPLLQAGDGSVMPMAVPLNVQLPSLGGYSAVVEIDGTEEARASFRLIHNTQVAGASAL